MAGYFSHNNNTYFFLHIPKTGGTMWSKVFSDVGLTNGHDFLKQKPDAYSFTLIRNPLDRLVSCFSYLKNGGCWEGDAQDAERYGIKQNSFEDWIYILEKDPDYYFQQQHVMPMMYRIGNKDFLDYIGLFENLNHETKRLNYIFHDRAIGDIPVINKGNHDNFDKYYTEKTKNIVEDLYKDDIKLYKEILNGKNI